MTALEQFSVSVQSVGVKVRKLLIVCSFTVVAFLRVISKLFCFIDVCIELIEKWQ